MVNSEQQATAMANRAIRNIRNELQYLLDLQSLTPQQHSTILAQIPAIAEIPSTSSLITPSPSPAPTIITPTDSAPQPTYQPPSQLNEKQPDFFAPSPAAVAAPPPAYVPTPAVPPPTPAPSPSLATASALYEYKPSDAGDLALFPRDRVFITEFMNADWAKGRNERTGLEGIFPRSYVNIIDEKPQQQYGYNTNYSDPPPLHPTTSNYGNLPLEVSQSGGSAHGGGKESKLNANGKKFGKKLGNATIFGAGATIGSNIVNGIL